jgi:hypothetical protein
MTPKTEQTCQASGTPGKSRDHRLHPATARLKLRPDTKPRQVAFEGSAPLGPLV